METPIETPISESPMGLYNRKKDIVRERSNSKEEFRNIPRMSQVGVNIVMQRYTIKSLNIGTPENHYIPFGTNKKLSILSVPILKYIRVTMLL